MCATHDIPATEILYSYYSRSHKIDSKMIVQCSLNQNYTFMNMPLPNECSKNVYPTRDKVYDKVYDKV